MEDSGIVWVKQWACGFRGNSHRFFRGYEIGMGIEIQSPWGLYGDGDHNVYNVYQNN